MRISDKNACSVSCTFRTLVCGDLFKYDDDDRIYIKTDEDLSVVLSDPDAGIECELDELDVCRKVYYELKEVEKCV